jgi:FkbM family methyltransferase
VSAIRAAAASATDLACRVTGRRSVVKAARFVLRRACLDVLNDPRNNGEAQLQRWILRLASPGHTVRVLDVGANVGEWSAAMLAAAGEAGRLADLELHAFEPSLDTFALLSDALGGQPVQLSRCALSDRSGRSVLHIVMPGAGINSLHESAGPGSQGGTEEVPTTTLAEYAELAGLADVALLKVDTEGHDMAVLRGARPLFEQQRIAVAQFEYNHRWVFARAFLLDAFELLGPLGYRIGKLTPAGVEFYPGWDFDLETFVEGNYVACTERAARLLPSVLWWKTEVSTETRS